MHATITDHREDIARLCQRFRVRRLDVFGSATTDRFEPARSDVDFVVEFVDPAAPTYADDYFGLKEALEGLLDRPVDLITRVSIRNPFLRRRIDGTSLPVYAS
jgi:hypothetical protein